MKAPFRPGNDRGFSLVELMVAAALMGLVAMAIFSLYQTSQRSASTEAQVVDVQQNVRVALQQMARDVRMAGFLLSSTPPLSLAPSDLSQGPFTVQSAALDGRADRVTAQATSDPTGMAFTVTVAQDPVNLFGGKYRNVQIIRPSSNYQQLKFPAPNLTVAQLGPPFQLFGSGAAINIMPGDMIVCVAGAGTQSVTYTLDSTTNTLKRHDGLGAQPVADNITGVAFKYLLNNGTSVPSVAGSNLTLIRAVQITITGTQTVRGQAKSRSLSAVVQIRN